MIITRSPMRISLIGGGTDFENFYRDHGCEFFSVAINKYVYIITNSYYLKNCNLIKYSKTEKVGKFDKIIHPLFRHAIKNYKILGKDINSISDIPSGSGLGGSSAFSAALIKNFSIINKKYINKKKLFHEVCDLEIKYAKSPIGIQDQFISVYGGIQHYIQKKVTKNFQNKNYFNLRLENFFFENTLLIYTGLSKNNFKILKQQNKLIKNNLNFLKDIKDLVTPFKKAFISSDIAECSKILNISWALKKKLSKNVTNEYVETIIKKIMTNGAYGSKILGAGGRGYVFVFCNKNRLIKYLKKNNIEFMENHIDNSGTKELKLF